VEWAWWTVEDEDKPDNLHAAEWVIRTSLKIDSAQSSNATLILIHAVFAILGRVRTGTISKLMGYELVERPINYEKTRFLASLLVSKELKRVENYARINTYQTALLETEGEENVETPQISVTEEDDIQSVDGSVDGGIDEDLSLDLEAIRGGYMAIRLQNYLAMYADPRLNPSSKYKIKDSLEELPTPKYTMEDMDDDCLVSARVNELLVPEELDFFKYSAEIDSTVDRASPRLANVIPNGELFRVSQ
jgi:hypothetical protein